MSKHTPGPWTIKPGANDANVFYDSDGHAVGTAYFREDEAEMHANRALLAAAPDLLTALKSVEWSGCDGSVRLFCPDCQKHADGKRHDDSCGIGNAIAKAERA